MNEERRKSERRVPPAVVEFAVEERQQLLEKIADQTREIERLNREAKNDAIAYWAVIERQGELRLALAALKAQPSGVVLMLREALELWLADYDEVASNPDFEPFPHIAERVAKTRSALTASAPNHSEQVRHMVREGWQLVPVEPSVQMERAGTIKAPGFITLRDACDIYKAMLAAAPSAGSQKEQGE